MKNVQVNIKIDTGNGIKTLNNLKVGFEEVYGEIRPLTTQLGELEDILYEMAAAGQQGTNAFKEIQKEVANSKKIVQETDKVIDAMSQTLGNKLGLAASGLAGAFGAAQGAVAIFGVESDAVAQTLVKLQSAMAIQQGLASFKESVPVIKQFGASIAAAMTSYFGLTAAKEADAVATGAATTATKGLSIAMKSIPIVAIVAGIAALATALYSYFKNSEEAEKAEKKRAEAAKKAKELADAQRASIAQESTAFVGLIYQLKETNSNSKERAALIKQINSQYGTTLKNLSDETAFQNQLNVAVKEYIAYQTLKVRIQSQEEYMTKLIQKRIKAEGEHAKILKNLTDGYTKVEGSTYQYRNDMDGSIKTLKQLRDAFSIYGDDLTEQERIMYDVDDALERAGLSTLKLKGKIDEITNSGKKYVEQTNNNTSSTKEETRAFKDASDAIEKLIDAEMRLNKINQDLAEYEYGKNLEEALNNQLESIKKSGQYSTESINMILDAEKKRKDDIIKNEADIAKSKTQNAIEIEAIDKEMYLKLQQNNDEYEQQKKDTFGELENAQEEYAEKTIDTEEKTQEEIRKLQQDNYDYTKQQIGILLGLFSDLGNVIQASTSGDFNRINESFSTFSKNLQEFVSTTLETFTIGWDKLTDPQKLEAIGETAAAVTEITTEAIDAIYQAQAEREAERIQSKYDKDAEALKNTLAQRIITQDEYDAKMKELQNKKDADELKAKRKAFEQSKKLAIINATIQTASAVLSAFSSGAAYPLVGPATGAIFAGIAAALGAVQIGVIASQKFQAARGGVVPTNGRPSNIDSVDALLAPNEMVINANSARMFPQLLSSINQAGGGVSLAPETSFINRATNSNNNTFSQGNNGNQPARAYIVYNDLKNGSDKGERLSRRGTFGR